MTDSMNFVSVARRALVWAAPAGLAACSGLSSPPAPMLDYQPESFNGSAYVHHFKASPATTCEAARRALLSQGYVLADARAEQVSGRKYFQPSVDHHVQLEFRVVCAADASDDRSTVAFVNGLQDQYVVRKVKESASLGVGGIGSLSVPLEGSMDSMVKIASETVTDADLYKRFFELVGNYLTMTPVQPLPTVLTPKLTAAPVAVAAPAASAATAASAASAAAPAAAPAAASAASAPALPVSATVSAAAPAAAPAPAASASASAPAAATGTAEPGR